MDLSALTKDEAQHVLNVLRRDMKLRKMEENRLSDLKHELEEEGAHCLLLAKQHGFNKQCCIRCCGPFSFIIKSHHVCLDCHYNVCKACCSYSQHDNCYICAFCHKSRLLKVQSLEWYYNNVKNRFKKFGSAEVLNDLHKKHIIETGELLELPGHRITKTITVALREAIEEATTKAEGYRDSLRSVSAISQTSDDLPDKSVVTKKGFEAAEPEPSLYSSLRKESRASILGWKNVERLDNSSASSVLQSPDGNWIALPTSQHSRPSLLTKRKSLVFSVLEKESGMISAYDEMVSDLEDKVECESWALALLQFRQHLRVETQSTND